MTRIFLSLNKCIRSFQYPAKGILYAIRFENNFIYHLLAAMMIIMLGFYFQFSSLEWIIILFLIGLVFITEIINTAFEKLVDIISPEYQYKAGLVKDLAAGAVLIASIVALVIGLIIIYGHL
ncbi:MAG: diacylglycerol kinase family protein [Candidatus Cyclobacteriaceae bacterium M3_2C_046]